MTLFFQSFFDSQTCPQDLDSVKQTRKPTISQFLTCVSLVGVKPLCGSWFAMTASDKSGISTCMESRVPNS